MNFNFQLGSYKKKDGTQAIRLKIDTSANDIQYLDADIAVLKSQWDKNKKIVKRHPLEDSLNAKLNSLLISVKKLYYKNDGISAKRLHQIYKNHQRYDSSSFISYYQDLVNEMILRKKVRTANTNQKYIDKLKKYAGVVYFSDLSVQWAKDFEKWMLEKGNKTNTIASIFK